MKVYEPFRYTFYHTILKEDVSDLRASNEFVFNAGQNHRRTSEDNLYILNKFPDIKALIEKYFNDCISETYGYKDKFTITRSWINRWLSGDMIYSHNHKECYYSGLLYYGDYSEDTVPLIFENPIYHASNYTFWNSKPNPMQDPIRIKPKKNLLIFFPSCINHNCTTINDERVSLAFNFQPIIKNVCN